MDYVVYIIRCSNCSMGHPPSRLLRIVPATIEHRLSAPVLSTFTSLPWQFLPFGAWVCNDICYRCLRHCCLVSCCNHLYAWPFWTCREFRRIRSKMDNVGSRTSLSLAFYLYCHILGRPRVAEQCNNGMDDCIYSGCDM